MTTPMKRRASNLLLDWKNSQRSRKPLLLNGARQVGKTWLLQHFAQQNYENHIHISLDSNTRIASYFDDDITPARIITLLEAEFRQNITPGKTLVIFDEIQSCERALTSLKYFAEDAPEYHITAAGSLLGVAINRERYSFPVGQVQMLNLHPMDFEEYLTARDETLLLEAIQEGFQHKKPLLPGLHQKAIERYREYLVTGGMPAVVAAFREGTPFFDLPLLQEQILGNYSADMAKYASPSETVKIRACFNSLPAQLGKDNHKFQYRVVRKGGSAAIYAEAIEWLVLAGVVNRCQKTEQGLQPVTTHVDPGSFKLYHLDTGLLSAQTGVRQSDILTGTPQHFQGALAENYVAQQLVARSNQLYYWTSNNTAEVDFVLQSQAGVTAIEVKSGGNTHSKSLRQFINRYSPERAIRLSLKPFGSGGDLQAVPLYAAFCL
ncbi:MAG: ATP-binding protein [Coriobacteriales bacterium]|nr:ATP-binding protein [Coriobacteriales bacterium]